MPNKSVEKRREAFSRWYASHKDDPEVRLKRKARDLARLRLPPQPCSTTGCGNMGERHHADYTKPLEVSWLCKVHHEDTHSVKRCSKCKNPHQALGLCYNHWRQQHRKKKRCI